jgi:hypothetical protein
MVEETEGSAGESPDFATLSRQILDLIFEREYDEASALIDTARQHLPPNDVHRLTALAAVLEKESGNLRDGINLFRQAASAEPTWLPHLYCLAVNLMEAERWLDADVVLDELIRFSESNGERYFIDEARFRKIVCLRALGRHEEVGAQKERIAPGTRVFMGDGSYGVEDLDQ